MQQIRPGVLVEIEEVRPLDFLNGIEGVRLLSGTGKSAQKEQMLLAICHCTASFSLSETWLVLSDQTEVLYARGTS